MLSLKFVSIFRTGPESKKCHEIEKANLHSDSYIGLLILPVIAIIAVLSNILLKPMVELIKFFEK